jgi:hypothetical protein
MNACTGTPFAAPPTRFQPPSAARCCFMPRLGGSATARASGLGGPGLGRVGGTYTRMTTGKA